MADPRPLILVSNDDGVQADGLAALVQAVSEVGEVCVVAPDQEQSAASHALSIHRPLRIKRVRENWYSIDGTPADCSYLAIHHILKDRKPTLMVSGINHGGNMSDDVTYSGTVAAAMEATLLGVPAIAFSLVARRKFDFGPAARFAQRLVKTALSSPLPPRMLLNVNVPEGEPQGYRVTRLGKHSYGYDVIENVDPRGRKYYWIGGSEYQYENIPGSDCSAVLLDKYVSITPLHMDLTDDAAAKVIGGWKIDG